TAAIPHAEAGPAAASVRTSIASPTSTNRTELATSAADSQKPSAAAVARALAPARLRATEHVSPAPITATIPETWSASPAAYAPKAAATVSAISNAGVLTA